MYKLSDMTTCVCNRNLSTCSLLEVMISPEEVSNHFFILSTRRSLVLQMLKLPSGFSQMNCRAVLQKLSFQRPLLVLYPYNETQFSAALFGSPGAQ